MELSVQPVLQIQSLILLLVPIKVNPDQLRIRQLKALETVGRLELMKNLLLLPLKRTDRSLC